jgi:hypothetical protein
MNTVCVSKCPKNSSETSTLPKFLNCHPNSIVAGISDECGSSLTNIIYDSKPCILFLIN